MSNNLIPSSNWKTELLPTLDCLYGYSHQHFGYLPFKEITDIVKIGSTSRIGVKGLDYEGGKLYIQLSIKDQKAIASKNWLDLNKFGMKIISNPKIERWDKVRVDMTREEIDSSDIEGTMETMKSYEIHNDMDYIFLGHLKENANRAIIQNPNSKAIYIVPKIKLKKYELHS